MTQRRGVDNVIVVFARFARRREGNCAWRLEPNLDFEALILQRLLLISSTICLQTNLLSLQNVSIYWKKTTVFAVSLKLKVIFAAQRDEGLESAIID